MEVKVPISKVSVSASLIEQALFNILDNALRYSPLDKSVTVSVYQQLLDVVIDIHDMGDGLLPKDVNRIFDLFYTGNYQKAADSGSGLGLAVSKGLITAHGGHIESVPVPKGCLFRIRLPVMREGDES